MSGDLALLPPQSGSGLWEIKFKAVDCPTGDGPTGTIQFRFMGSNDYYFQIQALNARYKYFFLFYRDVRLQLEKKVVLVPRVGTC